MVRGDLFVKVFYIGIISYRKVLAFFLQVSYVKTNDIFEIAYF